MITVIQTEPTSEPITLDEAKAHLRVDIDDDDALILAMIKASREWAESYLNRALITQTWAYYLDEWPHGEDFITLPYGRLQTVSSVKYTDYNISTTTMTLTTDYLVDTYSDPGRVVLAYGTTWPTATLHVTNPIEIIYICGFGTPDDIPESIKLGMKVDLTDMYENRQTWIQGVYEHLPTVERLYYPYRLISL